MSQWWQNIDVIMYNIINSTFISHYTIISYSINSTLSNFSFQQLPLILSSTQGQIIISLTRLILSKHSYLFVGLALLHWFVSPTCKGTQSVITNAAIQSKVQYCSRFLTKICLSTYTKYVTFTIGQLSIIYIVTYDAII